MCCGCRSERVTYGTCAALAARATLQRFFRACLLPRAMEDEAESVTWNISVVKICGELCSVKLRGWSVELLDVQREIKEATGIRKTRQLLFVGTRPCLPRQLLRDVLSLPGGVVTLVESTHHLRCGSCGVRGLFGRVPHLMACDGCRAVFYCNRRCQKSHWSTHRSSCLRRGTKRCADLL